MRAFQLSLLVTQKCNLHCDYCFCNPFMGETMTLPIALHAIEETIHKHANIPINILFMGGEPILSLPLIKEIVASCREKYSQTEFHFKIISNGTLIREKEQAWLSANSDLVEVTLSVDGDRETHNLHRCNSYDKIDFEYWEEKYPNFPTINMVITPETLSHLAENVIYLEQRGFYVKTILADGVEWDLTTTIPIFERELNTLIEHYTVEPNRYPTTLLTIPIYAMQGGYDLSPCIPGESSICIMPNGHSVPCYRCSSFFGDKEGLILHELLHTPISKIVATPNCANCCAKQICNACPAQVAGLKYNVSAADQYCALEKTLLRANAYAMTQYLLRQPEAAYLINLSDQQKKDIITNSLIILEKLYV